MHTVSADQRVAAHTARCASVCNNGCSHICRSGSMHSARPDQQRDATFILLKPGTARIQLNRIWFERAHRIDQHTEQIRAVHREIGVAVMLDRDRAQIKQLPGLTRIPQADFLAGGFAGEAL